MAGSLLTPALEEIKLVKSADEKLLTKPFLDACKHILSVIAKFGTAMLFVKSDIGGNITKLETKYNTDPSKYTNLYSMVQEEVEKKTATRITSCTVGLLWLTRALDFMAELFRNLIEQPDQTTSQACAVSYTKTLKQWHGSGASLILSMAIKLAPDRAKFMEVIGGDAAKCDMEQYLASFTPLLQENHDFLASVGMDELRAS